MTLEDIIESLEFREEPWSKETTVMVCSLNLRRRNIITNELLQATKDPERLKQHVKEILMREILNDLYDNQRQLMVEAILDLCVVNPMDTPALWKARDRILKFAEYQPPQDYASRE